MEPGIRYGEALEIYNPIASMKAMQVDERYYTVCKDRGCRTHHQLEKIRQQTPDQVSKSHVETRSSLAQAIILAAAKRNNRKPVNSAYRFQHVRTTNSPAPSKETK